MERLYHITLSSWEDLSNLDCLILAVAHNSYIEVGRDRLLSLFSEKIRPSERIFIDVKSAYPSLRDDRQVCTYWSL